MDARLIARALVNLIFNAVQAMPNGGTLTLSAKVDEGFMLFSVEDTGRGLSK
ncbi:MAG: ATP-binding protein [Candidatus Methanomethyliales bacterium]|nr:ATP-binding protein [Candidatus Methanomethylicales archaeon]